MEKGLLVVQKVNGSRKEKILKSRLTKLLKKIHHKVKYFNHLKKFKGPTKNFGLVECSL